MPEVIKVISGSSHKRLTQEVVDCLGMFICDTTSTTFSDGEIMIQINENVR